MSETASFSRPRLILFLEARSRNQRNAVNHVTQFYVTRSIGNRNWAASPPHRGVMFRRGERRQTTGELELLNQRCLSRPMRRAGGLGCWRDWTFGAAPPQRFFVAPCGDKWPAGRTRVRREADGGKTGSSMVP